MYFSITICERGGAKFPPPLPRPFWVRINMGYAKIRIAGKK